MRRLVFFCSIYLISGSLLFCLAGCSKTGNTAPVITINSTTAPVYADTVLVYQDVTLEQGTHFLVSLTVSKNGADQVLNSGTFSKSLNGGPDSVFQQFPLSIPYLFGQYFFTAGSSGNTEKYTFTFGQTNGQMSSKSITIKDSI